MIINEIYEAEGREKDEDKIVNAQDLVKAMKLEEIYQGKEVIYSPNLRFTKNKL